jgi:hypothetical protein
MWMCSKALPPRARNETEQNDESRKEQMGLLIRRPIAVLFPAIAGCVLMVVPLASAADAAIASQGAPKITIGPNMLVSRDGNFSHAELGVAVNPRNHKNIVSAAITASRGEGGYACKTYATTDGGGSWVDSSFREQLEFGGGDPQVGFGLHGTAYFTALAFVKDDVGHVRGGLFFYRSEDGGKTWEKPANLGYSYDHEVMTVDQSSGRFSGRVYESVLYGEYPEYTVGVFRSDDDGRSFSGPVDAASGKRVLGINTAKNIVLLSDGTLVLPYIDFEYDEAKAKNAHSSNIWIVSSSDGAVTFSEPTKVGVEEIDRNPKGPGFQTMPALAVDTTGAFKDRLYMAWTDYRSGTYRLVFSCSTDRGKTWSKARPILDDAPSWVSQYQPELAVNKDGVLAITWFDTRNASNHENKEYDEYFAASVDGGESFSAPVRVSDQTSSRLGKGNMALQGTQFDFDLPSGEEQSRVNFISGGSRWPAGGDYMQMAVDDRGIFHPVWADARTGTFQLQTAAITVTKPHAEDKEQTKKGEHSGAPAANVRSSLYKKVELVFDPISFEPSTGILDVPTRLKNLTSERIYGPITLEVLKFGSGMGDQLKEYAPTILNAANHKEGGGATFDYSPALGTDQMLEPGALSGQVVWHLKVPEPLLVPDIHIAITGMLPQVK